MVIITPKLDTPCCVWACDPGWLSSNPALSGSAIRLTARSPVLRHEREIDRTQAGVAGLGPGWLDLAQSAWTWTKSPGLGPKVLDLDQKSWT